MNNATLIFSDAFSNEEKSILSATIESNIETLYIDNIDFKVEIRKEDLNPDLFGYMIPLSDHNDHFGIAINSKNDLRRSIATLGHEMIHVEQHLHDRLVITDMGLIWKDSFIPSFIATDMAYYRFLPWEIEAHKYDKRLFSIAMEKVKID